ncbi:hypothetical protein ES707_22111 [subsurface metagenome]
MNKTKLIILSLILLCLLGLIISCDKQTEETTQSEKLYVIRTYNLTSAGIALIALLENPPVKAPYNDLLKIDKETAIKMIVNGETEIDPTKAFKIEVFTAKEIIDYSDKNIRFINNKTNLEEFITADYIEIQQIK